MFVIQQSYNIEDDDHDGDDNEDSDYKFISVSGECIALNEGGFRCECTGTGYHGETCHIGGLNHHILLYWYFVCTLYWLLWRDLSHCR